MNRVIIYSGLLLAGLAASQIVPQGALRPMLQTITLVCLSYIMLEVGLEFTLDKDRPGTYLLDFAVAMAAAGVPWILCAGYLSRIIGAPSREAWLVALFAAPTSAGVLFTMLAAAGLSATWVFRKARVLAIFDDLGTLLLLIPLQMAFTGFNSALIAAGLVTLLQLAAAYRWLHQLPWPTGKPWLVLYGAGILLVCGLAEHATGAHWGVLMPSFVLGCLLRSRATVEEADDPHSALDQTLKAAFMFLVGYSLPPLAWDGIPLRSAALHVLALTLLFNIGKCVPLFFYRAEAGWKERLALSVAMFPRGEVGAGILLSALTYGIGGLPVVLGCVSLALNLVMTGVFIRAVAELAGYETT